MRTLRGAVIGAGGIARQSHLPAFRALHHEGDPLTIVALVDPAHAGKEFDGIPVVATREELGRIGPIDFVDICTPSATHLDLVIWSLRQGYHVVCEKPVALSLDEAEQIARAARQAGRVVLPCHQHRFNPAWRQLSSWVASGAIGRWHLAEFDVYRPAADAGLGSGAVPWRGRSAVSRGGVLLDHGTHLLYLLTDLAGMPDSVQAWTGRLLHAEYDVEDSAQLLLEFGHRAGKLFLSWAGSGRENRIRFVGDGGLAEWKGGELRLETPSRRERLDFTAALDKAAYAGWFGALFREFVAAVDRGAIERHLDDVRRVAELLSVSYRSANEGRRLPFGAERTESLPPVERLARVV